MADESKVPVVIWQRETEPLFSEQKPTLYRIVRTAAGVEYERSGPDMFDAMGVRVWVSANPTHDDAIKILFVALVEFLDEKERQCRR
jgi:hypothetical protein